MIIDSHVHISNPPLFNMPPETVIESMQKYNIDISIVSNGDSAECDHNQNDIPSEYQVSQTESINRTIKFAKENKNLFKSLFLSNNLNWVSIENVLDEKWNQSTIINLVNKHGYNFENAKSLFMHVWLYANGLATLIATNDIDMDDKEIIKRLVKIYKELVS